MRGGHLGAPLSLCPGKMTRVEGVKVRWPTLQREGQEESDIWRPWDRKMEGSGEVSVIDMESLRQRGCQRELTVVDHLRGWRKTSHREKNS